MSPSGSAHRAGGASLKNFEVAYTKRALHVSDVNQLTLRV